MNYILFDDVSRESLKPLTYIRPVCDIRVGILTIREKWERYLGEKTSTMTEDYLTVKYPSELSDMCKVSALQYRKCTDWEGI